MIVVVILGVLLAMAGGRLFGASYSQKVINTVLRTESLHRRLQSVVLQNLSTPGNTPIFRIFDTPVGSGNFVLAGVVDWNDLNNDFIVDWVDTNLNGELESGEGEIATVFEQMRIDFERADSRSNPMNLVFQTGPVNALLTPGSAGNAGICAGGTLGGRDMLAYTVLKDGVTVYGIDELPCQVRLNFLNTTGELGYVPGFEVLPSGMSRVRGIGGGA